jgi:transposase
MDRKRKKKGSNADWYNPYDPEAKISKMKDGSTHLAHKEAHAVDMDTGAVVAVTLDGGTAGDTTTLEGRLEAAEQNLEDARGHAGEDSKRTHEPSEVVADKGYHSKMVMLSLRLAGWRSYIAEPRRGRQHWDGESEERDAVYANRRRKNGHRGRHLMRRRGEIIERTFAHVLETGGRRRRYLCHQENMAKRLLVHIAGYNLGLLMRKCYGVGKPRCLQGQSAALWAALVSLWQLLASLMRLPGTADRENQQASVQSPVLWLAQAAA